MIGCLNCNKEINPETGRRPKKFCSDKCRAAYNAKNRNKEPKWVQRETYEKLMEENKRLKEQIQAQQPLHRLIADEAGLCAQTIPSDLKKPKKELKFTKTPILNPEDPMPIKQEGEDALDFAVRKNEWKKRQNK